MHSQPKTKRNVKAEGGEKRDHIGSCKKKGRGQRDGGWRKEENMKNKTVEKLIFREKAFPLLPWLWLALTGRGIYSLLAATHHVPGTSG